MEATKDKSKKLLRSRSLRSVGRFMQRLLRTLSSLSHLVDGERNNLYREDDDGGFKHKDPPREEHEECRAVQGGDHNLAKAHLGEHKCQEGSEVPGVQGLKNHGNTCFMNAVVQCLSNTDLLAEYLGMEHFRAELSRVKGSEGPQRKSIEESRGEVTEGLASLVRGLWTLEYTPQLSADFKNVVAKYGSQFRGNSQHDALEFLLWLLDRVHEDLNSPFQKPKLSVKPLGSDHGSMGSAPSSPIDIGQSFVQEHFQAQYRSSLTCPHCHKQSDTFDPFLCVSLPIPLRQTRALNVTLVFQTKQRRFLRIGLAVPLFGTIASLRQMVADLGSVPSDQVILVELHSSGLQRSFSDDEDLNVIAEGDPVYAIQSPPPSHRPSASHRSSGHPHSLPSSPRCCDEDAPKISAGGSVSSEVLASSSKLLLLLCNLESGGQQAARFGPPLILREERTASWDQLQQSILGQIGYLMRSDAHVPSEGVMFSIRVVGAPVSSCYLSSKDGRPLQHPSVSRALQLCGTGGTLHVKLAVEWEAKMKERLFGNIQEEVVQDDESVRSQQVEHQQQMCTLDECFQLYTKDEQLAPDDAWRCPHCKVLQQGTVKLSLWTLPDILIVHLKRFRQVGGRRNKLSTLVKFPLAGMDMAPHVVKRGQGSKHGQWSSWKQMENGPTDVLYDLYAVCNHHGSLQGGHYTAYCRNSVDSRWYSYDDSNVEHVLEDEVCTRGAYLLFYQKRNAIPAWSASSSVKGSTSSAMSDHWVLRLNGSKRESLVSRATTSCTPLPKIPDSPIFLEKEMNMEKGSKSFVRGVKGRSASMKVPSVSKLKLSISKAMPLRWSFGSKDRPKPETGELVEYLESGRRPKYSNDPIVPMTTNAEKAASGTPSNVSHSNSHGPNGTSSANGHSRVLSSSSKMDTLRGKPNDRLTHQDNTVTMEKGVGCTQSQSRDRTSSGDIIGNNSTPNHAVKVKVASGVKGDPNQRHHANVGGNRSDKTKPCEAESDGKSSKVRTNLLKKVPRRQTSCETPTPSDLHNGISRTSLSNGAVVSGGRASSTMPRKQKDDLSNNKPKMDIRRAHSSSNVQSKAEWTMKRSASLYRNGRAPLQPPRQTDYETPRQVATEKATSSTLQRMKYQTSSLGRKKTVPESSF